MWELEAVCPKAWEHITVTSLQTVGGMPVQQKGAGTGQELARVSWVGEEALGVVTFGHEVGVPMEAGERAQLHPGPMYSPDISAGGPWVCPHFLGRTLSYREGTDLAQVLIAGRARIWVIPTLGSLRLLSCDLGMT